MEEWGSGSEESDEEDGRQRLGYGDGTSEEEGDSDDAEQEAEEAPDKMQDEEDGNAEEEQMSQSERRQAMAATKHISPFVEDSNSESYSSEQDSPKTIGKILSSDRRASTDNGVLKGTASLQISSAVAVPPPEHSIVKKSKAEATKRPRKDTEEEEIASVKGKKDAGGKEEEEQMFQSERRQTMAAIKHMSGFVEDSDSESCNSKQDSPNTISKILSSDRRASPDNGVSKGTASLQKCSGEVALPLERSIAKKAKVEATKWLRKDTGEEEIAFIKRKKDAGGKIFPSSDVSRSLKFKDRMDSSENDANAGKKSRKQNLRMEASSQLLGPINPSNGELEVKRKHSQKMDMVAEKMEGQGSSRKKQKKPVQTTPFKQTYDSFSPQKQKKPAVWTPNDENVVAVGAMHCIKAGLDFPPKKGDDYWVQLSEEFQGKWTRGQIYEKLRRMKSRYQVIADRMKIDNSNTFQFKNVHEENLFSIWRRTWGKGGKEEKEEEEEEEEEEELKKPKEEENNMKICEGQEQKAKRTTKSRGKLEVSLSQNKEVNDKLGTPRDRDDEHVTQDAEKIEYKAQGAGAVEMETLLQRCSMKTTVDEVLKQIQDAHKAFTASCKQILQEVEAKSMLIVQSALKTAGNSSASRNAFSIPSLATADCLNMPIPCMNGLGDNKLRKQWHEQHIQELKVFSQRLHLIQEECRIQQEHFDMQLNSEKL